MPRQLAKLSPRQVETVKEPGRHGDGGGLYLVVDKSGAKRWVFLYRWKRRGEVGPGRLREMGLGSFHAVGLKRAREKATDARALLSDGLDPISAKRAKDTVPSFGDMADEVLATKSEEFRSDKSEARVRRALQDYAAKLRPISVDAVDTAAVLDVLKPIWNEKPETARNVRGYIEGVLNAAKAKGYRSGENPAAWRGHLDHLLPKRPKLSRGHFASLPYTDVPDFVAELHERKGAAALALEFMILTAARTSEVLEAQWSEIDLEGKVWTVPATRIKAGREHRVPLSSRAVEILQEAVKLRVGEYVFPSGDEDKPLSGEAWRRLLKRMGRTGFTLHGFRSSFRDWAGDETGFPREVAEAALAHIVGDEAERAYRRSDALEKRRKLMDAWDRYVAKPPGGNVTELRRPRRA